MRLGVREALLIIWAAGLVVSLRTAADCTLETRCIPSCGSKPEPEKRHDSCRGIGIRVFRFGSAAMNAVFIKSAVRPRDFPRDEGAEVAVVGRSNSGKSSAVNAILGSNKLARVSKTPGRTQLINFFALGHARRCVDLPGYGFARVSVNVRQGWETMMTGYFESRRSLRGLMLTVDVRRGLGELDERMLNWLAELAVPAFILATKADKLSRNRGIQAVAAMSKVAATGNAAVCLFSAVNGTGLEAARAQLASWLEIQGP